MGMSNVVRSLRSSIIEYPTMADAEEAMRRLEGAEIQGTPVRLEIMAVCLLC